MAKAEHVKKLIGSYGRPKDFRAAALKIIEEADTNGHKPLAVSLRKVLEANVREEPAPASRGLTHLGEIADPSVELVDAIDPQRGLADIVLSHEARGLVDRVLEEHHRAEELRRHSLPLRSKLLLCGPPGCGKTLCAEVIARELSLPLYVAKLDVIISSFLGETSTNLRRLFEFASRRPSVLFLDEFDALARARNDASQHNELRRVVNSLLIFIDRFKGRGLLIAASNLESALDGAVWRRFDEVITFDPPGPAQIEQLLQLEFRNFPVNFDLGSLVSKLAGLSYAEIERVCLDSIKSAVLKRRKGVSETEFAAAVRQEQRRKSTPGRTKERRSQ
jgi:SpoVK/Ycf46/Vps4 family AAA+-type ATPase